MNEKELLSKYLPAKSVDRVLNWIKTYNIHFKISKSRKTKLGDYRPPIRSTHHRISVNHDLNPYSFLITFVHELAHLIVFENFGRRVQPHGPEWKSQYGALLQTFLSDNTFPDDITEVLKKSARNTRASSTTDLQLSRALARYDKPSGKLKLEELEAGSVFVIENGRKFKKGEKIRTRYKCRNMQNNRFYLFHPLTPVVREKG